MNENCITLDEARVTLLAIGGAALEIVRALDGIGSVKVFASDEDGEPFAEVVAYDRDSRVAFRFHHDFYDRGDAHE